MSDERTEKATPHRRQKAREQGDLVHSRDLTAACAMLAGTVSLGWIGEGWMARWGSAYAAFLSLGRPAEWREGNSIQTVLRMRQVALSVLSPLVLLFAAVAGAALLAGIAQTGGVQINFESLQPKFGRHNPATNLKSMFSARSATRLVKSLLPAAVLGFVAVQKIEDQLQRPALRADSLPVAFSSAYGLMLAAAWILFAWSGIDYLVEWRSREARLRMSKQEMREEHKQNEGNPQVRGRIRSLRRQMRRKLLKADVRRASVVVTNPTHYAVALGFDFDSMEAPRVLAKGRDLLAAQIKDEARWAGIPIVENPPLARALYRQVETGQSIPFELYAAVAAILAWLYRQQVQERVRRERPAETGGAKEKR